MLAGIVGGVFKTTLKGRLGRMCNGPKGTTHDNFSRIHILILSISNSRCDCWNYSKRLFFFNVTIMQKILMYYSTRSLHSKSGVPWSFPDHLGATTWCFHCEHALTCNQLCIYCIKLWYGRFQSILAYCNENNLEILVKMHLILFFPELKLGLMLLGMSYLWNISYLNIYKRGECSQRQLWVRVN